LDTQVAEEVKNERLQRLQKVALKHAEVRSQRYLGKIVEVLVEGRNLKVEDEITGRTRQGRAVFFEGNLEDTQEGEFVRVLITEARPWSLRGELKR